MKARCSFTNRKSLIVVAAALLLLCATSWMPRFSQAHVLDKEVYKITGQEGNITGAIAFNGDAPAPLWLDMKQDFVCAQINDKAKSEDAPVAGGKLANAFVYVKSGEAVEKYAFLPPSSEVTLEHSLCVFAPRVLGIQAGQTLKIINSDRTMHNTYAGTKINKEWNKSQPSAGAPVREKFNLPEMFIPFKCDRHPWEIAYLSVMTHPFFAVSDSAGRFVIQGLPPGIYTIAARHERFGEQTANVAIGARESTVVNFTFGKTQ